jgi:leader peptidase (prepilin peptidase) / N-methyltransferase
MLRVAGLIVGLLLGLVATKLADVLPRRHDITHLVTGAKRTRRNVFVAAATIACSAGIAEILARTSDLGTTHALLLLAFHATVAMMIICASAIDLEHMILPTELTVGGAVLCVATSPFRSVGIVQSALGAVTGYVIAYVPFWLYKRFRGRSGMGLGDAMFAVLAGAWFGPFGAVVALFGGAPLMLLGTIALRVLRIEYQVPESVVAEIAELRRQAEAGDADAKATLEADPMAADVRDGILTTRVPMGPFLALASLIMLFARRWIESAILAFFS